MNKMEFIKVIPEQNNINDVLGQVEEFYRLSLTRGTREVTVMLLSDEGDPEKASPEEQAFMEEILKGGSEAITLYLNQETRVIASLPTGKNHWYELRKYEKKDAKGLYALTSISDGIVDDVILITQEMLSKVAWMLLRHGLFSPK
jgi:hypothetical protein